MKRGTFNYIKEILGDYTYIDQYIKDRLDELEPITLEKDRRLRVLAKNKAVIKQNLESSDEDTRTIIYELYIKPYPTYTMEKLIDDFKVSCNKTKAYRLRNEFFNRVAYDLKLDI